MMGNMTSSVQDLMASDDALDKAFKLPDHIVDEYPQLGPIHDEIVLRLKDEARGMPMNTVQTLLLERIAYTYVFLKYRELKGEIAGKDQKDFNSFWLSMTQEFNRLLGVNEAERRDKMMDDVVEVFNEAVALIQDKQVRQSVQQSMSTGLSKKGL